MKAFDPANVAANKMIDESVAKQIEGQNKLFIAYLKNQTPDDKNDPQQMMQNIMSMMQATQHIQTNKYLKESLDSQREQLNMSFGQYLGRTVEHKGHELNFTGEPCRMRLVLPDNIETAQMTITTPDGKNIVSKLDPRQSTHNLMWDAMDDETKKPYPPGKYVVTVTGESKNIDTKTGKPFVKNGDVFVKNFIDTVLFDKDNIPVLYSGDVKLHPKDITTVQKTIRPKPVYNIFENHDIPAAPAVPVPTPVVEAQEFMGFGS